MKFGPKAGSDRLPAHRLVTLSIATSEVAMTDSATLLRDHVTLQCRSLDRIFLQAYVPKLQSVGQGCTSCAGNGSSRFPPRQPLARSVRPRSRPSPSLRKGTQFPWCRSRRDRTRRKSLAPTWKAAREGKDRVVLIGIAPGEASVWRSWPQKGQPKAAHPPMKW